MSATPVHPAANLSSAPYKGLVPYTDRDYALFFGRNAERSIISANLRSSRFTLLYGPSGVGKTSVIRAGVVHALRERGKQNLQKRGTPEFAVVYFNQWRDDPVVSLRRAVRGAVQDALGQTFPEDDLASKPLDEALKTWAERVSGALLIIFDQFEDYFLYHANEDGPGTIAYELPRVVTDTNAHVNFLVAIRDDALAKLDRFEGRIPTLFDNYIRIDHLNFESARQAIVKPIEQFNKNLTDENARVSIEPGLVEQVLEETRTGRVSLGDMGAGVVRRDENESDDDKHQARIETPFLQLVMTRLWEEEMRAGSHELRLETLNRLGGAERIVRTHLDNTLGALPSRERAAAAGVFHYLVTPSGSKIAHTARDLAEYTGTPEKQLVPVLEKLSASGIRILRPVAPPPDHPNAPPRYEIFHDVLAPAMLDWRRRYYVQRRTRRVYLLVGTVLLIVLATVSVMAYTLYHSRMALAQKAQEAQDLSQAILTAQPTGQASVPPTMVALRETAVAVGTSAAAVTCPGAPSIRFEASKSSVAPGESVLLLWNEAQYVKDVSIEPNLGKVSINGSEEVKPRDTTKYILTAEGCGGKTTHEVTIQVIPPTITPTLTNLPPTETAVPTTVVPPTNTNVPRTRPRPTATTLPTATQPPTIAVPPGIYVTSLRVDPSEPRSGDQIIFHATFLNTVGPQEFSYCVELFRGLDVSKSVGISTCRPVRVELGTSELFSTGWNVREGACTQYLARAISQDSAKARTPILQPDGNISYLNFTVCP